MKIPPQAHSFILVLTFSSLAIKRGLPPFHSCLPEVTRGVPLHTGFALLTGQKVAPPAILCQTYKLININLIILSAILSVFIGA